MSVLTTNEKIERAEQFVLDHFDDAQVDFEDVDLDDLIALYGHLPAAWARERNEVTSK